MGCAGGPQISYDRIFAGVAKVQRGSKQALILGFWPKIRAARPVAPRLVRDLPRRQRATGKWQAAMLGSLLDRNSMRLEKKIAIVVGAGQGPGTGMGNGRATCIRFAQEGAKVMAVDRDLASAEETAAMVEKEGGERFAHAADVTRERDMAGMIEAAQKRWGRLDILHYN